MKTWVWIVVLLLVGLVPAKAALTTVVGTLYDASGNLASGQLVIQWPLFIQADVSTVAISGATNANPIVVAATGHGYSTGDTVYITGVGGNTNANGFWSITVTDADHFSIPVAGNGSYTSGGTSLREHTVASGTRTVNFTGGAVSVNLEPTTTARVTPGGAPAGIVYTVFMFMSPNSRSTQYWNVSTTSPTTIGAVTTPGVVNPTATVKLIQLEQAGATGEGLDYVGWSDSLSRWSAFSLATTAVTSVFGRHGNVVATPGDYNASQVTNAFDTSTNNNIGLHYFDVGKISTPGNPASGYLRLYANTSTGQLACIDNTGASCFPTLYYQRVQSNTTNQTQRTNLNFSNFFTITDVGGSDRTTVDVALSGDASNSGNVITNLKLNGVSFGASPALHTIPIVTNTNITSWKAIPTCLDSAGQHLNYDQSTDTFSCGNNSAGTGAINSGTAGYGAYYNTSTQLSAAATWRHVPVSGNDWGIGTSSNGFGMGPGFGNCYLLSATTDITVDVTHFGLRLCQSGLGNYLSTPSGTLGTLGLVNADILFYGLINPGGNGVGVGVVSPNQGNYYAVGNGSFGHEFQNAGALGTSGTIADGDLVKVTAAGWTRVAANDAADAMGVVETSFGGPWIIFSGTACLHLENSPGAGDWVIKPTTNAGQGRDAGASKPTPGTQIIGRVGAYGAGSGPCGGSNTEVVLGFDSNGRAGILSGITGSIGGGLLAAGACATGTATVTGATIGMGLNLPTPYTPGSPNTDCDPSNGGVLGVSIEGRVSAADTVTVSVCSPIAGTPTACTYAVRVTP